MLISALLQFKESFIINKSASSDDPFAYPKVKSWTLEGESSDCCSWDGVSCDEDTGHVIGLDLSSSCLYGSINSNSSLFRLVHLQSLNLAHNHFNYSQIPSQVGNLSRLTYLNLSSSVFSGEIPFEVSKLSQLSSLDMGGNFDLSSERYLLQLTELSLTSLVGNLTHIENLDAYLMLPNLRVLDVKYNKNLTGSLPDFEYWRSPLEEMIFADTSFSGELPASMGNLGSLIALSIRGCNFSGSIPYSIGSNRLTGPIPFGLMNLTQLHILNLEANEFQGQLPISIFNLKNLILLNISNNSLSGTVLICNMTSLLILDVSDNYFSSSLPQCLHNSFQGSKLRMISLRENKFRGLLPRSWANCTMLETIDGFHMLNLSNNILTGHIPPSLGNLTTLESLVLSQNRLSGEIPPQLAQLTFLEWFNVSHNNLTGSIPQGKQFNTFESSSFEGNLLVWESIIK
uniref:Leucine-rich repeat-containing N-terminal plant-type domain-containing protein n=1 Tax=Fagus sylvatica TaxID=28930 RepID=A0A2N9GKL3_FAGSY